VGSVVKPGYLVGSGEAWESDGGARSEVCKWRWHIYHQRSSLRSGLWNYGIHLIQR